MVPTAELDLRQVRRAATEATGVLRVLANVDRLLLLCQLAQGERCVSELEELLGIQQPTLSQQLGVMRTEGVVATRREGKHIYYQIADPRLLKLLETLYQLYCKTGKGRTR
jgi:DNA-binding transcriptional ArsR family regulator